MSFHVAVDIGASSGKILLLMFDNQRTMGLEEVHSFKNEFKRIDGYNRWDINHIYQEIIVGLEKVKKMGVQNCTLGIDTWAVDYCLLDEKGDLLGQPISYRDNRTINTMEQVFKKLSKKEIYQKTGIQFQDFNTLFQLFVEDKNLLNKTDTILMIPDYLAYRLTGKKVGEKTNISTTQLLNIWSNDFDENLLDLINLPREKFPELVEAGTLIGELKPDLYEQNNLPKCKVVSVATHDTASAIVGVPATNENWSYLSSGTWSLIGVENDKPIVSEDSLKANYTNEAGAFGTYRYLKNITGMWCIQEISRILDYKYSYSEMAEQASEVEPFLQYIDLNDSRFTNPENMILEIQAYCSERGFIVPKTVGELTMAVYSNLALAYYNEWQKLEELSEKKLHALHIVGGGGNIDLLNQLTADLIDEKVIVGPTEASAIGNLLVQLIAEGYFNNLEEARRWLSTQIKLKEYLPNQEIATEHLKNYQKLLN